MFGSAPSVSQNSKTVQLLLLTISICAAAFTRFSLAPLQEAIRLDLGLTDNQIAWLQGPAVAVPMALAAIPLGLLVDRSSRVRVLLVFALLNLAAALLSAVASSFALLLLFRCLTGLAATAIFVAAYSAIADMYAPAQRGRASTVVSIGEIAGAPAAFALGGFLLASAGSGDESWRWALLWMSVMLFPAFLLLLALREPQRTDVGVNNPQLRQVWPELWQHRSVVVPLLLARIMVWIAIGAAVIWAAPSFARRFALSPDRIGVILATGLLVSGLLGPLLGGPLADLCQRTGGPRRTVTALWLLTLLSVPAGFFAIMPSPAIAGLMLTAFLTLAFTIGTAALALALVVIPGELRGLFVAIQVTAGAVFCDGLAPLVVSGLSSVLGGPPSLGTALAIVCGVTSLVGALVFGFGRRHFSQVTPPALAAAT